MSNHVMAKNPSVPEQESKYGQPKRRSRAINNYSRIWQFQYKEKIHKYNRLTSEQNALKQTASAWFCQQLAQLTENNFFKRKGHEVSAVVCASGVNL